MCGDFLRGYSLGHVLNIVVVVGFCFYCREMQMILKQFSVMPISPKLCFFWDLFDIDLIFMVTEGCVNWTQADSCYCFLQFQ